MKTLLLYSVVYLARFLSIIASDAYLPLDRSGDWVYRCTEGVGVITMGLLLLCARRFRHTYYSHIVALPFPYHLGFVLLLLSLPLPPLPLRGSEYLRSCQLKLVHPGLAQHHVVDVLWAFSHYVEAMAVYPQLVLFSKSRVREGSDVLRRRGRWSP